MKLWLLFLVALLLLGVVSLKITEKFQPEFLDRTQIARTIAAEDSSYDQRTNHMDPAPYRAGPVPGIETPFRVNQYTARVV